MMNKGNNGHDELIHQLNASRDSLGNILIYCSCIRSVCVLLQQQVQIELKQNKRVDDKYEWRVENYVGFIDDEDENLSHSEYWVCHELNLPEVPTEFRPPQILQKESFVD